MTEYEIIKCACKGVPTHLAHDFIINGLAKTMKPLRMKEALIRIHADSNKNNEALLKELGENVWYSVEKQMKSVYIKRKGEGITYPIDVSEIPELEEHCKKKTFTSIKKELAKNGIRIKKPTHKNLFENSIVPHGYFDGRTQKEAQPSLFVSQKIFYLSQEQCEGLKKNTIWFSGDVLQVRKSKSGKKLYYIHMENYKGKKVPINFWGAMWVKFFNTYGLEENLLNNFLEVTLANNYTCNSSLQLRIKISPSKRKGHFESENIQDEDELSEKELETLMSQDWSKIKCPTKK